MTEISQETKDVLEGLKTEIGANRTLAPSNDYNDGWNSGADMAIKFICNYERGEGLFQVTPDG